ncbi:MAG: phosphatidylglycerophosphatase A [Alphaproteobacteria bacterium]|nr:phosphatidylglycerophosphatase A [Alphaproteobacteria bacterium]
MNKLDLKQPYIWLATWFCCGFLKPAPGTWGSAGALPVGLIIYGAAGLPGLGVAIVFISIIGAWAADRFNKASGLHDSGMIVIDEVAGQWIALLPALYIVGFNPLFIGLSFVLFRVFDIFKPWPVSFFDKKVSGGIGVMADDLVAGAYAALCMMGVLFYAGSG